MYVVALPNYVVTSLRSTGLNLTRLQQHLNGLFQVPNFENAIEEYLKSKLSKFDMEDTYYINRVLATQFSVPCVIHKELAGGDLTTVSSRVNATYYTPSAPIEEIMANSCIDIYPDTNFILVVVKAGFTNVINAKLENSWTYFLNLLIKRLYTMYPNNGIYNNVLVKELCKTLYNRLRIYG